MLLPAYRRRDDIGNRIAVRLLGNLLRAVGERGLFRGVGARRNYPCVPCDLHLWLYFVAANSKPMILHAVHSIRCVSCQLWVLREFRQKWAIYSSIVRTHPNRGPLYSSTIIAVKPRTRHSNSPGNNGDTNFPLQDGDNVLAQHRRLYTLSTPSFGL